MPEERKLVTVLFADVTESTALGEELDPEDVRALMGRYYDHARQVISQHDGTLEKFIGDAVMAVFGLPHAHGDDAERAIAAGLSLRKAVSEDAYLTDMRLRIGVNTGEVVAASDPSEGDFLVTGDAVNVAARLQQSASPGEVLVSERTYVAAGAAFLFGEGRAVEVKGKREPLRVFPVEGVRETRQVTRPPMVGREDDLMMLSLLHRRAVREQRPQLVSIVAPAGTGKTRLLEAFLDEIDPGTGAHVAVARCSPYGQTLAYWPLRGLLEDLVGGIDRERVVEALAQAGHAVEDAGRLADLVLSTLGIETETPAERESIFNAWELLVEALARSAPLIIVFEDLHWASDSLLDLVEHIMHPRTRAPLLLIAISRPELLDRRPTWGGGGRQSFTALVLDPLDRDHTAELVAELSPDLTESVLQRIVDRSGGNPFFATELIRCLADQGAGAQAVDAVPDTVHAAVLARLDRLEPEERRVLQAAAVGGRAFRPATLHAVLGDLEGRDLDAAIDGLLARDLITPDEGGAFTFRHILIRDVAYGTLSRAERIRMHAAVAAWLEDFAGDRTDEFVGLIAYHYREAVLLARRSTTPLTLPCDPEHAVTHLERAGELAGRSGAFAEAQVYLRSAIEIAAPDQHIRLYEKLGDVAAFGDKSIEAYREALELWRSTHGDPLTGARLLRKILIIYTRWQGSVTTRPPGDELTAMREEAKQLVETAGDEAERWRVRVTELFWPFWRGDVTPAEVDEGRAVGLEAAAYFEGREEWDFFHAALDARGVVLMMSGDHESMVEAMSRRIEAPAPNSMERGDAVNMLSWTYTGMGAFDASIDLMERTLAERRAGDLLAPIANGVAYALQSACLAGRWDAVDRLLPVIFEAWDELEHDVGVGYLLSAFFSGLHVALARQDRPASDAATAALGWILAPQSRAGRRMLLAAYQDDDPSRLHPTADLWVPTSPSLPLALMFLAERGALLPASVMEHLRQSAEPAKFTPVSVPMRVLQALEARDPDALARAIDAAEDAGMLPHAARMRIVLAEMTGDPAPLEVARPVLERLQDRQFLRRLEEVAAVLA